MSNEVAGRAAGWPGAVVRPLVIVVSAPSGAGKTTLSQRLLADHPRMVYSVSCTTRVPRNGETAGRSYHFLSAQEFAQRLERGEFLEHAEVHGYHYGTLREPVAAALAAGRDVLMDIDVQGAAQLREYADSAPEGDPIRRGFVEVFVVPPSRDVLLQRLTGRGTESSDVIARRMRNAEQELRQWTRYQYLIVNDRLEEAYAQLRAIVAAEHCRVGPYVDGAGAGG